MESTYYIIASFTNRFEVYKSTTNEKETKPYKVFQFDKPIIHSFISNNIALEQMAYNGFMIYVVSYIGAGFNIYASAFFTALNNGVVSATISFMRTLVFDCVCILILPIFLGLFGIWSAKIVAEILTLIVSCFFVYTLKKKYDY